MRFFEFCTNSAPALGPILYYMVVYFEIVRTILTSNNLQYVSNRASEEKMIQEKVVCYQISFYIVIGKNNYPKGMFPIENLKISRKITVSANPAVRCKHFYEYKIKKITSFRNVFSSVEKTRSKLSKIRRLNETIFMI